MSHSVSPVPPVPRLPEPLQLLLRPLPLLPLQLALGRVVARLGAQHPGLFARLGAHAGKVYLVDATDLPFVFRLSPAVARPSVEVCRRPVPGAWDARIAGPLAALLGMIHGSLDGDALFFSRDIVLEGDTEAVLALRNALDDAEIDLLTEAAGLLGPFLGPAGPAAERTGRRVLAEISRLSGVALLRTVS